MIQSNASARNVGVDGPRISSSVGRDQPNVRAAAGCRPPRETLPSMSSGLAARSEVHGAQYLDAQTRGRAPGFGLNEERRGNIHVIRREARLVL